PEGLRWSAEDRLRPPEVHMELEHRADEVAQRTKGEQRSQAVHLVAGAVLGAALLAFILQNSTQVPLSWLFFSFTAPLWLLVIIIAAASIGLAKVGGYFLKRNKVKAK